MWWDWDTKGATNGRNKQSDAAIFYGVCRYQKWFIYDIKIKYLFIFGLELLRSRKSCEDGPVKMQYNRYCRCWEDDQWIFAIRCHLLPRCCRLRNKWQVTISHPCHAGPRGWTEATEATRSRYSDWDSEEEERFVSYYTICWQARAIKMQSGPLCLYKLCCITASYGR